MSTSSRFSTPTEDDDPSLSCLMSMFIGGFPMLAIIVHEKKIKTYLGKIRHEEKDNPM